MAPPPEQNTDQQPPRTPRRTERGPGEKWSQWDRIRRDWVMSEEIGTAIDNLKNGKLAPFGGPRSSAEDQQTLADVRRIARNMGITDQVSMYVDTTDRTDMPMAMATELLGRKVVIVNDAALNKMTPRQLESVIGHEVSHLVHNDSTVGAAIADWWRGDHGSSREARADREATGPLGTCDPQALADALQIGLDTNYAIYRRRHPKTTKEEFTRLYEAADPEHGAITERIRNLHDAAQHPVEGCPVTPASTPTVPQTGKKAPERN